MARKKIDYEFKCESCGHIQEPDEGKSNGNWKVFLTKCSECSGKVKMIEK